MSDNIDRAKFYANGGQTPKQVRTDCIQCGEKFVKRDYYQANGITPIQTVRTCRYCKHITAKKNGFQRYKRNRQRISKRYLDR